MRLPAVKLQVGSIKDHVRIVHALQSATKVLISKLIYDKWTAGGHRMLHDHNKGSIVDPTPGMESVRDGNEADRLANKGEVQSVHEAY